MVTPCWLYLSTSLLTPLSVKCPIVFHSTKFFLIQLYHSIAHIMFSYSFYMLVSSNRLKSEKMKQSTFCLELCSLWCQVSNSSTLRSLILQWQIPSSSLSRLSSIHFIRPLSSLHWNDYAKVTRIFLLQCDMQFLIFILLSLWVIVSSVDHFNYLELSFAWPWRHHIILLFSFLFFF